MPGTTGGSVEDLPSSSTLTDFRSGKLWPLRKAQSLSDTDVDFLMACIAFESAGTFSPSVTNPVSHAVGLIQFMPVTATRLGTTTAQLAQMTAVDQLAYVEKYFAPWTGKLATIGDLYMAILWPKAIGRPDTYVLFEEGSVQYDQNKALDTDGDGKVTRANAVAPVEQRLVEGRQKWFG